MTLNLIYLCHPLFLMTSHLNSHRTADIKPEMLSGVQTGNGTPHDKYNIRGIAHARTNRKYNIFMQRQLVQNFTYILEWGRGTCTLTKHTRRWTYPALRYFFRQHAASIYGFVCSFVPFVCFVRVSKKIKQHCQLFPGFPPTPPYPQHV